MKKFLIINIIISTLITSSLILTGCGNSQTSDANSSSTTDTSQTQTTIPNNDNSSTSYASTLDKSNTSKKTNDSSPNKNQKNDKTSNKVENSSNNNNDNSKINNPISDNTHKETPYKVQLKDLATKIADLESDGNVQYITPVTAIGFGKNLSYEEDLNSTLFFCSDNKFNSKNLKYGIIVNLFNHDKTTDTYSFIVSSYESLKNGGTGIVDHGTINSKGKIKSGNLN